MPQKVNTRIIIIVGVIVLVFILLLIFVLRGALNNPGTTPGNSGSTTNGASPTIFQAQQPIEKPDSNAVPSIYQQSAEYLEEQRKMDLTIAPENEKSTKAGLLLEKVPYKGKLFTFDYSTDDLAFKVILDSSQVLEANQEFDAFLKQNGIEDKSWLRDLKIEYK